MFQGETIFFLMPGFSNLSLASAVHPLSVANRVLKKEAYRWRVASLNGGLVRASNGLVTHAEIALREVKEPHSLFLFANDYNDDTSGNNALVSILRQQARRGIIGGVGTASFQLACAGLLNGYRATIHWEVRGSFQECYPHIDVRNSLYEIDRNRITCGGGMAPIDLMLHIIELDYGKRIASEVSALLLYEGARSSDAHQAVAIRTEAEQRSPVLAMAIKAMEDNLDSPLSVIDISRLLGISQRQLERVFQKAGYPAPMKFYRNHRLKAARELLRRTSIPLRQVCVATGFDSISYFSTSYRQRFGYPPGEERRLSAPHRA